MVPLRWSAIFPRLARKGKYDSQDDVCLTFVIARGPQNCMEGYDSSTSIFGGLYFYVLLYLLKKVLSHNTWVLRECPLMEHFQAEHSDESASSECAVHAVPYLTTPSQCMALW